MTASKFDLGLFTELWHERGLRFGRTVEAVAVTGSTNEDALEAARTGAEEGTLFVADVQTAGRGRRGRRWLSPPDENLLFSLVLRPRLAADRVSVLTLLAGLGVRAATQRRTPAPVLVKWPNDIVSDHRKLAGVLVEAHTTGSDIGAVVVGVGINVRMTAVPEEIAEVATSLALLGDPDPRREPLLVDVLAELEARFARFSTEGIGPTVVELRAFDALRDEPLLVEGEPAGTGAGIDEEGALLVASADGTLQRITSGTIAFGI